MSLLTASEWRTATIHESDLAIRLEDVSVRYKVTPERINSLKEYVLRRAQRRLAHTEFFALRDVTLEVHRGEALGVIGRNGAGKSTLLKVVSRVIRPTAGRVWVRGRVAPLLELGAGFHPELTGRENVFLNGALLGHTQREIQERFQQIVDFADIGEFIDAPLRTYSTGMVARLGFAVATAWVPDILILDEVLSVGDAEFQIKSSERIQQMRAEGATVLLVSHSGEAVQANCDRAIWLDRGQLIAQGSANSVTQQYRGDTVTMESNRLAQMPQAAEATRRWGSHTIEIVRTRLTNKDNKEQTIFKTGDALVLQMDYIAQQAVESPIFGVAIHRHDGMHISGPNTSFANINLSTVNGHGTIIYSIPYLPLLEGLYDFSVAAVNHSDTEIFDYHDRLYPFRVVNDGVENQEKYGLITLQGEWKNVVSKE